MFTDAKASPTGLPFKIASVTGTLSEPDRYEKRPRICDLGYLRKAYQDESGRIQHRCAAEPPADYLMAGGDLEETFHRICLCNGLMAAAGFPQLQRGGYEELPVVTSGDALEEILPLCRQHPEGVYFARDVVDYLLSGMAAVR